MGIDQKKCILLIMTLAIVLVLVLGRFYPAGVLPDRVLGDHWSSVKVSNGVNELSPGDVLSSSLDRAGDTGTGEEGLPWWKKPPEKKVRMEINMPWGVGGIRGN